MNCCQYLVLWRKLSQCSMGVVLPHVLLCRLGVFEITLDLLVLLCFPDLFLKVRVYCSCVSVTIPEVGQVAVQDILLAIIYYLMPSLSTY